MVWRPKFMADWKRSIENHFKKKEFPKLLEDAIKPIIVEISDDLIFSRYYLKTELNNIKFRSKKLFSNLFKMFHSPRFVSIMKLISQIISTVGGIASIIALLLYLLVYADKANAGISRKLTFRFLQSLP